MRIESNRMESKPYLKLGFNVYYHATQVSHDQDAYAYPLNHLWLDINVYSVFHFNLQNNYQSVHSI